MAKNIDETSTRASLEISNSSARRNALHTGTTRHTVKITETKVMHRQAFLEAVECLDEPGFELPDGMDGDARMAIVRTWRQLKERGIDASSLVDRQGLRGLVANHEVTPGVLT